MQYLSAGIWAVYPLAVASAFSSSLQHPVHREGSGRQALAVFLGIVFSFPLLYMLGVRLQYISDFTAWIMVFALAAGIPRVLRKQQAAAPPTPQTADKVFTQAAMLVTVLVVLVGYCYVFSFAYSTIPARGGESRPRFTLFSQWPPKAA